MDDVSGAHADLGRHASAKKGFHLGNDAEAVGRFLMGNVISGFSVRQMYDRFLANRRAVYAWATSQARMLAFSFGDCRDSEKHLPYPTVL